MADPARVLFGNASYDGQLTRTLAAAMAGSADLGEALATARRIGKPTAPHGTTPGHGPPTRRGGHRARRRGNEDVTLT